MLVKRQLLDRLAEVTGFKNAAQVHQVAHGVWGDVIYTCFAQFRFNLVAARRVCVDCGGIRVVVALEQLAQGRAWSELAASH